jgi:hypothetical protein
MCASFPPAEAMVSFPSLSIGRTYSLVIFLKWNNEILVFLICQDIQVVNNTSHPIGHGLIGRLDIGLVKEEGTRGLFLHIGHGHQDFVVVSEDLAKGLIPENEERLVILVSQGLLLPFLAEKFNPRAGGLCSSTRSLNLLVIIHKSYWILTRGHRKSIKIDPPTSLNAQNPA